ncbi:MAG: molybdenum cofactor guanylyltransferase [Solirubrobacteraceae bacterium]
MGVVLAGGLGRRLGGSKATVRVNGLPLITYPVHALRQALGEVVIAAKSDTELPGLPGVAVWIEPDEPCHPLAGLVHALELAQGRAVLICACDLPLVTPELVRDLARTDPQGAAAVVARADGRPQPLLGCYRPGALGPLRRALDDEGVRVLEAVARLDPRNHDVEDPALLFNVNTPEDLLRAGALLSDRPRAGAAEPPPISRA